MVPASKRRDWETGASQTSAAAARSTCSVTNVSECCPVAATAIARGEQRIGTSSMRNLTAPTCVNAFCASALALATLAMSSQMLPVSESHCADEPGQRQRARRQRRRRPRERPRVVRRRGCKHAGDHSDAISSDELTGRLGRVVEGAVAE